MSRISQLFLAGLSLIFLCNWYILRKTEHEIYKNIKNIPKNEVGLVLGTSKLNQNGEENLFYKYRIEAAAKLYYEGKIKTLILSGNNDSKYYNEPLDMKKSLTKLGIPAESLICDYRGVRTYDSILRAKNVFNNKNITIISQKFHDVRALFLAKQFGINAVAYAAQDVPLGYANKTLLREYLARPKAILDVYVLHPAFSKLNIEIPFWEKSAVTSDSISIYLPDSTLVK